MSGLVKLEIKRLNFATGTVKSPDLLRTLWSGVIWCLEPFLSTRRPAYD